jgi:hypothetical protein
MSFPQLRSTLRPVALAPPPPTPAPDNFEWLKPFDQTPQIVQYTHKVVQVP